MSEQRLNALAGETSPYLLQHAGNPVDWMPWGEPALAKAREENKLIFLSIGYAACHWCHVMEHESFEDADVAAALNRDFVSIKVDREERPDLDEIYMTATMAFNGGQGGWPMSVFLAPDLKPIFAGTYFPKENAFGRPGFRTVLRILAERWREQPEVLLGDSDKVVAVIRQMHSTGAPGEALVQEQLTAAAEYVRRAFDPERGGIPSGSNKFPPSAATELLLRIWRRTKNPRLLGIVELSLEKMAQGGIYDHLGGGIHRYSTDREWLVPHFEKMLYDQGLVASAYLDAAQATATDELRGLFLRRARGICDYVTRDLRDREGAFYSSEDADSEGLEGKFYVWTRQEVDRVIGDDRAARVFRARYDVSDVGNWPHPGDAHVPAGPKNILRVVRSLEEIAATEGLPLEDVAASVVESRRKLFEVRSERVRPALDDKILTGWNGLMIGALAKAAFVLAEPRYAEAAAAAADFIWAEMRQDGRLFASRGKGRSGLKAYASDYAFLIDGLIALFEATGDFARLNQAGELTGVLISQYWDPSDGGFFFTADDHEEMLVRSKTAHDGATPSANSVMLGALVKLAALLERPDLREKADIVARLFGESAANQPFQSERLLAEADTWLNGLTEIVIVGDPTDDLTEGLIDEVRGRYLPNKVLAGVADPTAAPKTALFAAKTQREGRPTAYLCRGFRCEKPTSDPIEFGGLLDEAR